MEMGSCCCYSFDFCNELCRHSTHIPSARTFQQLQSEVRAAVEDKHVLATALYYLSFQDQTDYFNFWLYPTSGKHHQTFEQGVRALGAEYIIIDDHFIGTAVKGRDSLWMHQMMMFLSDQCTREKTIHTSYFAGNRFPDLARYPREWRYPEMKEDYLRRVQIFRINRVL